MEETTERVLYVLDTNVLMHDPAALFRFEEHDVYVPMVVLEELDRHKKGNTEVARNARQASRFLADMSQGQSQKGIEEGIALGQVPEGGNGETHPIPGGRLYFQTNGAGAGLPVELPGSEPDNTILKALLAITSETRDRPVVLVSKDINMRIKAAALGLTAEDYRNDEVLKDVRLLHSGIHRYDETVWGEFGDDTQSWKNGDQTYYRVTGDPVAEWAPNEIVHIASDHRSFEAVVESVETEATAATLRVLENYRTTGVWGITARNDEQNHTLNLLMDPEVDLVTLIGQAGTGKTLLALAAGLEQTVERGNYREILMTRATQPVGEDIGFLPGTEEEKMTPWMGALFDNLEVLNPATDERRGNSFEAGVTSEMVMRHVKVRSMNFMRGRTFQNRYIIVDEAQNLTSKQIKTLVTRAGPGTKMVILGDLKQIDTPYLTETTSGLTYLAHRFRPWEHGGHLELPQGERSRLSKFAAQAL
ncbi:PhoH family protein [Thioalkalivibrio sp. ALE23]|uniref:PhoH family protein n=1 Tax=Thioalkalivibrio sp. ALE23 TaxID=1265495 RepID=UPI00036B0376|nr:PhoH family protein [Thioalkalivibrio sp. ALE23]